MHAEKKELVLTAPQLAALRSLKDIRKPAEQFDPAIVGVLVESRMVRMLSDNALAISSIGLTYLFEYAQMPAAEEEPTGEQQTQDAALKVVLSENAISILREVAIAHNGLPAERFSKQGMSLRKLRDAGLMVGGGNDRLMVTDAGRAYLKSKHAGDMDETHAPHSNGVKPYAPPAKSEPPLPPEIPAQARLRSVEMEIQFEADTLPEAVEMLHEIADAVSAAAQNANPDYDPHIDDATVMLSPDPQRFDEGGEYSAGAEPVETTPMVVLTASGWPVEPPLPVDEYFATFDGETQQPGDEPDCLCPSTDGCRAKRVLDQLMQASPEIAAIYEAQAALDRGMAKVRGLG